MVSQERSARARTDEHDVTHLCERARSGGAPGGAGDSLVFSHADRTPVSDIGIKLAIFQVLMPLISPALGSSWIISSGGFFFQSREYFRIAFEGLILKTSRSLPILQETSEGTSMFALTTSAG
jgi:hypothetical protein